jgi:hypothetical protein
MNPKTAMAAGKSKEFCLRSGYSGTSSKWALQLKHNLRNLSNFPKNCLL